MFRYAVNVEGYAEADEFQGQIMKAKEDTWEMICDGSVGIWIPHAADTIAYQHGQILELKRKLARLEPQRVDLEKPAYYVREYPTLEAKLKQTVIEQTIMLRDVQCPLLATRYIPLTKDERKEVTEAWEKSRAFVESRTTTSASGVRKPEPVPDRSNSGTFGLFYEDYDSDSDSDRESNDTTTNISPTFTGSFSAKVMSATIPNSPTKSKGVLYCLSVCWRSRKLTLAGFIILLLILFNIYRLLTRKLSSNPYNTYDGSIYNDKEVSVDDWNIHWTHGVPSYTHETPSPVVC